jgi:hypothetical protein
LGSIKYTTIDSVNVGEENLFVYLMVIARIHLLIVSAISMAYRSECSIFSTNHLSANGRRRDFAQLPKVLLSVPCLRLVLELSPPTSWRAVVGVFA